jgi:probable nitrogen fixation protein
VSQTAATPGLNPFLAALLTVLRAQDLSGRLDSKSPAQLLAGYLVGPVAGPAPILAFKPVVNAAGRLECFFAAAAREVERRGKQRASALVSLNREGIGRGLVLVGRLVGALVYIRDAEGFGFATQEALVAEGERLVAEALALAGKHPGAAAES